MAMVFATGKTWFMVPEAIRVDVTGRLQDNTTAKDVILRIIGSCADGATYRSVELAATP